MLGRGSPEGDQEGCRQDEGEPLPQGGFPTVWLLEWIGALALIAGIWAWAHELTNYRIHGIHVAEVWLATCTFALLFGWPKTMTGILRIPGRHGWLGVSVAICLAGSTFMTLPDAQYVLGNLVPLFTRTGE